MIRIAHIDGLRAIAVLAVLLFHLNIQAFSGGFVGVDVFFVISGYVITRMIVRAQERETFTLAGFFAGRLSRLMPALLVTVICSSIAAFLLMTPAHMQEFSASAISAVFGWSNVFFWSLAGYFDTDSHAKPLLHTWTLSVEWQFYLIWPFLLILARRGSKWVAPGAVIFVAIASLTANIAWQSDPTTIFYWMPFRMFEFAIGAVLVWTPAISSRRTREALCAAGLLLIGYAVFTYDSRTLFPSYNALPPAIGAALVILGGHSTLVGKIVDNPVAAWLGRVSYSTYLVHWPLIVFYSYVVFRPLTAIEAIAIGAASIALGAVSYYAVELPFWKGRLSTTRIAPAAVVTASLCVSFVAVNAKLDGWEWRTPQSSIKTDKASLEKIWGRSGCVEPCEYGDPTARYTVLVMGDSHVDHYAQTLRDSGGKNFNFRHLHGGSCYFGKNLVKHSETATDGCIRMNAKKVEWLHDPTVAAVVHGQRWIGYTDRLERPNGSPLRFKDVDALIAAEIADIEELYKDFAGPVVLLNYVPSARLSCLSIPKYLGVGCRPTDLEMSKNIAAAMRAMQARHPGKFSFVDPADYLCDGVKCSLLDVEGRLLYVDDAGHLSRYGAWKVVPAVNWFLLSRLGLL